MSAQIIPFIYNEQPVRSVMRNGEPWFVGKDVCGVLAISNHNDALARLDEDERAEVGITDPSGTKYAIVVSEPGVYRLVFTSRKPQAEAFKRWLAHEVLPQLRKTGRFALDARDDEAMSPADRFGDMNARLNLLREARLLFGRDRARGLWAMLGLPAVPQSYPTGDVEPYEALDAVLQMPFGPVVAHEALSADIEQGTHRAEVFGLKVMRGAQRFAVAGGHPALVAALRETPYAGKLLRTLARLPGAEPSIQRFAGQPMRCALLPVALLDERPQDFDVPAKAEGRS